MGKVYISGPITGTDDYVRRFREAEERLAELGHEAVNPAKVNSALPASTTWEEYMAMSMQMLRMCDAIYMLEGWEESRGANREYGYALGKGYKVMREAARANGKTRGRGRRKAPDAAGGEAPAETGAEAKDAVPDGESAEGGEGKEAEPDAGTEPEGPADAQDAPGKDAAAEGQEAVPEDAAGADAGATDKGEAGEGAAGGSGEAAPRKGGKVARRAGKVMALRREGWTYRQIAEEVGITPDGVRKIIKRQEAAEAAAEEDVHGEVR